MRTTAEAERRGTIRALTGSLGMAAWPWLGSFALLALVTGCYGRAEASRDTNRAWVGHSQKALEDEWGAPTGVATDSQWTVLRYVATRTFVERTSKRPSWKKTPRDDYGFHLLVDAGKFVAGAIEELTAERARRTVVDAEALVAVDPDGRIAELGGASSHWGPPDDANIRWGTILGMHLGMGALDDTATPLPSGGAYIGGMLARTLGLVGTFSLASGHDDAGGAMAFGWGMAPQYWVTTRLWVRGGPAMILAFDPGFRNAGLEPGVTGGVSFAALKAGTFVLDLRLDLSAGTNTRFGTAGVGVHLN